MTAVAGAGRSSEDGGEEPRAGAGAAPAPGRRAVLAPGPVGVRCRLAPAAVTALGGRCLNSERACRNPAARLSPAPGRLQAWPSRRRRSRRPGAEHVDAAAASMGVLRAVRFAGRERGSTVVVGAAGIAFLLVIFAGCANFVLDEYAKGALRTAVDEAAQAGAAAGGSLQACQAEAEQVQRGLLHGSLGADVTITCQVMAGGLMLATASGDLPSLLPAVPRLQVSVSGLSVVQGAPAQ